MNEVTANVWSIPADVNWNPQEFQRHGAFLDESTYTPDEPERGRWDSILSLLPDRRRASIDKCGRFALHVMRQTRAGAAESLQPVSCCDRTACPLCSIRYALGQGAQRLANLAAVVRAGDVKLWAVTARVYSPAWAADVRAAGCEVAEGRGRLCAPAQGCGACAQARQAHARAATVETDLRQELLAVWSTVAKGTGGVYITAPESTSRGLEIVIRLLVPAVAVHEVVGPVRVQTPGLAQLTQAWHEICAKTGAESRGLEFSAAASDDISGISRLVLDAHIPAFERLQIDGRQLHVDDVRTLARAAGLTGLTESGKVRRVQRTAWFGIFAGRTQAATLAALEISRFQSDTECVTTVVDCYKILDKTNNDVRCQSTRYGAYRVFPSAMFRRHAYCDMNAAPLSAPDPVTWGVKNPHQETLEKWRRVHAGADRGHSNFKVRSLSSLQSALKKELGTLLDSAVPIERNHGWRTAAVERTTWTAEVAS